jgi:hypothetical protein
MLILFQKIIRQRRSFLKQFDIVTEAHFKKWRDAVPDHKTDKTDHDHIHQPQCIFFHSSDLSTVLLIFQSCPKIAGLSLFKPFEL